jgi:4-amino-4-deoxy-L-arabinose transferase-like glycosyltransferase
MDPFYWVTLIVAITIRIAIGLLNESANDNHIEVSQKIVASLRLGQPGPAYDDCWECYHARGFHMAAALPCMIGNACAHESMRLFGQLLNTVLSSLLVVLVGGWIGTLVRNKSIARVVFALVALNPRLIYIGAQATNDMCAIFFGSCASYYLYHYLRYAYFRTTESARESQSRRTWGCLLLLFFSSVLCFISKGSAFALAGGIMASWAVQAYVARHIASRTKRVVIPFLFLLALVTSLILLPNGFAPYERYIQRALATKGAAINFEKPPPPPFFSPQYYGRPGVTSIVHGFFTFRLLNLIKYPWIENSNEPSPIHRTSLWSQLYGRLNFVFFDQWPVARKDLPALLVGRTSMITAFLPLLILIYGGLSFIRLLFVKNQKTKLLGWIKQGGTCVPFALSYLMLLVVFCYNHRGFEAMKVIYILPALLGFVACFVRGLRQLVVHLANLSALRLIVFSNLWAVVVVYILNSALLFDLLIMNKFSR